MADTPDEGGRGAAGGCDFGAGIQLYAFPSSQSHMGQQTTRCEYCGYRVHWNPETREGPTIFFERGLCPSCNRSFEDRAPVSARRGKKRQ